MENYLCCTLGYISGPFQGDLPCLQTAVVRNDDLSLQMISLGNLFIELMLKCLELLWEIGRNHVYYLNLFSAVFTGDQRCVMSPSARQTSYTAALLLTLQTLLRNQMFFLLIFSLKQYGREHYTHSLQVKVIYFD